MRYYIPTARGMRVVEDAIRQCWVAWYCKDDGQWYNEYTGSEQECLEYISKQNNKDDYQIRYNEFD